MSKSIAKIKFYEKGLKMYFLKRMSQPKYYIGLWVGLIIAILHFGVKFFTIKQYLNGNQMLFTPYTQWIGYHTDSWTILFYLVIPIISCLGFNQAIYDDLKTGFITHLVKKLGFEKYIFINYFYVFLNGFFTVFLPLIINFLLFFCTLPNIIPDRILNSDNFISPSVTYFLDIYYKNPVSVILFYCFLAGIIGGICAITSVTLMGFIRNYFTDFAGPFLLTVIMDVIAAAFPFNFAAPTLFIIPMSPVVVPSFGFVVIGIILLMLVELILVYVGIKRNVFI
ncbi:MULTISPECIES: hypothetical protein [Lactobacillus]|uniref:Uncharacterized protein n=1 Tax=Lactobacillus xujianguonis TaxID=2495899 RepID=A0A437SX28_9LACO|nr:MULTISPECIES: hypothetical protein [Lactobacillus]RVU71469.1 hypothetical protein EJK17_01850 [Lactobacillus xujianguonis]RVU73692.1 hypothetical protein EJK20_06900 [Lactobacillus xujianguonis]